tara:strand:+ start:139 stop:894 length:756 start_codon:yes stop_codon:yes gene_type:complete
MPGPLLLPLAGAAAATVARYIAKNGVTKAIKKYGKKYENAAIRKLGKRPPEELEKVAKKNKDIRRAKEVKRALKKDEKNPLNRKKAFKGREDFKGRAGEKYLKDLKEEGVLPKNASVDDVLKLARKQPDTAKFSYYKGKARLDKIKTAGKAAGAFGAGALLFNKSKSDKKEPTFKEAFSKAKANKQKTFSWKDPKTGKTGKYTTDMEKKKYETSGAGVGKTSGLRKKSGGRIRMRGGGRVMGSKSRGTKYI